MNKLPNLLIIGVFKAGTTSLFHYLNQHPQICGALKKETHFFSPLVFNTGDIENFTEYSKFFSNCNNETYTLEASPSYLYGGKKLIPVFKNNLSSGLKLILILRNPADRFLSYYNYIKTRTGIPQDESLEYFVEKCIEENDKNPEFKIDVYSNAIKEGLYADYLKTWMAHYNPDNLFVCFFEDLNDPRALLFKMCDWLKIDKSLYENFNFTVENKTVMPKFPALHQVFVKFNKQNENFFRKRHNLKRVLRSIYFFFNKSNSKADIPAAVVKRLDGVYKKSNTALAEMLTKYGVTNLPHWLK